MQHCLWCGTELPANARFCGNCGRLQAAQPPGAQPEQTEEKEGRWRVPLLGLPRVGNASLSGGQAPIVPGTPSLGQAPIVPGTPSLGQAPIVPGTPSLTGNAASSPNTPSATRLAQKGRQAEQKRFSQRTPQKGLQTLKKMAIPGGKWIAVVIVSLVVVAASAGALVLAANHPSQGQNVTRGDTTSGGNSRSKASLQPTGGCSHSSAQPACTGNTPTQTALPRLTADLTFSGVASGHVVLPIPSACGPIPAGNGHGPGYGFSAIVTPGGKQYLFDLLAEPYTGPGTYSSVKRGQIQDYPMNPANKNSGTWGGGGGEIIITGNAGTLDVTYTGVPAPDLIPPLPAPPGTFHVVGSWNCG